MQNHISSQASGRSNIVAAVIIATGLIVSAIIIAKPNFSLGLPPISRGSVGSQFTQQMIKNHAEGKQYTINHSKTTLQDFKVRQVLYSPKSKSYLIEYSVEWRNGYSGLHGCSLQGHGDGKFSGSCAMGEDPMKILVE